MKLRKLIALVLAVFVMAAFAVVPSFAATDVSSPYLRTGLLQHHEGCPEAGRQTV